MGRWRINQLRAAGTIAPVSRTWCREGAENRFVLTQGVRENELQKVVRECSDRYAIWSLVALNAMLVHQRVRRLILVEVEKREMQEVFTRLQSRSFRNVILETDSKWVVAQVGSSDFDVVVRQLVTKAPLENTSKGIPSLEKIIVDLFDEGQVLAGIPPLDLEHMIRMAFTEYTIDVRRLRTYASRRNVKSKLLEYISWLGIVPKEVLYDP